jgi:hypothetical protein
MLDGLRPGVGLGNTEADFYRNSLNLAPASTNAEISSFYQKNGDSRLQESPIISKAHARI